MKKCLFLLMCVGVVIPTFAGTFVDGVDQIIPDPNIAEWVANGSAALTTIGTDFAVSYDTDLAPNYAEITYTFGTVVNMTDAGGVALGFDSCSSKTIANDAAPIYVVLEDADFAVSNRVGTFDADTSELSYYGVTTLNFVLSDFTGIDLTRVKKMTIGIGDPGSPVTGKAGVLMVDYVRRFTARYREELYPEDLDKNKTVDLDDLKLFAQEYLLSTTVTASDPSVVATSRFCFPFNEGTGTVTTSISTVSARQINGVDPNFVWELSDCPEGSCLVFDGNVRRYHYWYNAINALSSTTAFWAKADPETVGKHCVLQYRKMNEGVWVNEPIVIDVPDRSGNFNQTPSSNVATIGSLSYAMPDDGAWHHYALVKETTDGGKMKMYIDGILVKSVYSNPAIKVQVMDFYLGGNTSNGRFKGKLDYLVGFNRALTQQEVVFLAKGAGGSVVQPPLVDIDGDGKANLADLARIASLWLENVSLWPLN